MNYINNIKNNQSNNENFIKIPSNLTNFVNTNTRIVKNDKDKEVYIIEGYLQLTSNDVICSQCKKIMTVNNQNTVTLKHIPIGSTYSYILVNRKQLECTNCGYTKMQHINFKADNHFITKQLKAYAITLLEKNCFTNKEVAFITGLNRNLVKDIDKERLLKKYTENGLGKKLTKPEDKAKYLCIDEFKLHDGYKYATHIIDYETGHILWIAEGKKKKVVYDFIEHVGIEWMNNVIAVACDMNSDFQEAFKEKCPHIEIVYDYFHIVKNLNETINNIRKDEQKRLIDNGDIKAAKMLKKSKYILCSAEDTLIKKDQEVKEEKIISKGSNLFNKQEIKRKGSYYERHNKLIQANEIFLIIELIKIALNEAYHTNTEEEMVRLIFDLMELCEASGNSHLNKFKKLIYNHFDGIITHANYKISTGKIEGINNKIKTLRRQAYGYPDDEYFFLKLFDMSRN